MLRRVPLAVATALCVAAGCSRPTVVPPSRAAATASASEPAPATGWVPISADALDGVELGPSTETADGGILALGQWRSDPAPDGSPPHATIWTSPTGLDWARQADSPAFARIREGWTRVPLDLLRTDRGFVAVGMDQLGDGSQADAAAWFSDDGVAWSPILVGEGGGSTLDEVIDTPGGLVAVGARRYDFHAGFGDGTSIWTSPDGRSWTKRAEDQGPPLGVRLRDVTPIDGGWLALASAEISEGAHGLARRPVVDGIWRSDDGVSWLPIPGTPLGLRSLIATPDGVATLGAQRVLGAVSDLPAIWRSSDGRTWSRALLPNPTGLPPGSSLRAEWLAVVHGAWFAVGDRDDGDQPSVAWTSPDGAAWSVTASGPWGDTRIVRLQPLGAGILVISEPLDGVGPSSTWFVAP